ncbi:MAG: DUF4124 domain-containing protein [Proteobacteria bacterium]|nr:DUF4124 domain-containing protein [Pseudomonadota bacterium]
MRYLIPALFLLLLLPVAVAGTYKWVDKDGNTHYSDTPVEGAEPVKLPEPTTFDPPKPQPRKARSPLNEEPAESEAPEGYATFEFISPKHDQIFWATGGEVPVQLSLEPGLRQGHGINLYFNGKLLEDSPMSGLGTTLTEAFRGAHTVRAVIVNAAGEEIASAGPVTFHVKQRSIINPR